MQPIFQEIIDDDKKRIKIYGGVIILPLQYLFDSKENIYCRGCLVWLHKVTRYHFQDENNHNFYIQMLFYTKGLIIWPSGTL